MDSRDDADVLSGQGGCFPCRRPGNSTSYDFAARLPQKGQDTGSELDA